MVKILNKLYKEKVYLNIIKAMDDKPTGNITFNKETLKDFPLRKKDRNETGMFLFNRYKTSVVQGEQILVVRFVA